MPKPWQPPVAKLPTKDRDFHEIVRDLRFAVFSVVRMREDPPGQNLRFQFSALGSGFFVSPTIFLTCNHVVNGIQNPHQAGDMYKLVRNTGQDTLEEIHVPVVNVGQELHLFPDYDAAILQVPVNGSRPFAAISYANTAEGREIGVAGYPLPAFSHGPNQEVNFALVYRASRGVVNSIFRQVLNPAPNPQTANLETIEVDFLFVPGNSGGPIFDGKTGRVLAYVHGYKSPEISQKYEDTSANHVGAGAPPKHVQSLHATYSVGISLANLRAQLEQFGVAL